MKNNLVTLICTFAFTLGVSSHANASLVDTAVVDNLLDFSIEWSWDKAGNESDAVLPPNNWLAPISVSLDAGVWTVESTFLPAFTGITGAKHTVNPHSGETDPGFTPISLTFADGNLGTFIAHASTSHTGGPDTDMYWLTVTNAGAAGNTITIEGMHVPVPAAMWLFGSGLLGLMRIGNHKKSA